MEGVFEKLVNYSLDILAILEINGNFKFVNRAFSETLGGTNRELTGRNFQDLFVFKDRENAADILKSLLRGHPIIFSDGLFKLPNGNLLPIHWSAYPDLNTQVIFLVIHEVDAKRGDQEIFKMALEVSPTVIFIVKDGKFQYANLLAEKVFGYTQAEFIGKPIEMLVPPRLHTIHNTHYDQYIQQPYTRLMGTSPDLVGVRKDGTEFPLDIGLNPIDSPHGSLFVCSVIDITYKKAAENSALEKILRLENEIVSLGKLALTDDLTSLCNRRALFKHLELQYRIAQKEISPLSFLLIDIDDFKSYNDTFGHLAGDEALKLLAHVITASFRRTDIIGRYGGEEIGVILPATDASASKLMGERLQKEIAEFKWPHRKITVSLGMATIYPRALQTASLGGVNDFISMADMALYSSKRSGKNKTTHFNDFETSPLKQLSDWKIQHDTPPER